MEENRDYLVHNISGAMDRMNYSAMPGRVNQSVFDIKNEEKIKFQEDQIKQLKRALKAYQKNTQEQNQKLSSQDNLLIEYYSLNKNYTEI